MPIPYASSSFAGVAFGLLLSAPAAGFEPMSRAYRAQAAVPANVVILLDSSSSMAMTMMGEQSRLQVARDAVRRLLHQQRLLRAAEHGEGHDQQHDPAERPEAPQKHFEQPA